MKSTNYFLHQKEETLATIEAIKYYIQHTDIKYHNYAKYQIYKYAIISLNRKLKRITDINNIMNRLTTQEVK
jgi:hypothetical protein